MPSEHLDWTHYRRKGVHSSRLAFGYRDEQRRPDDRHRLSRYYYDVGMMALTDIADRAVENQALLKHVRDHTLTFFRRVWMKSDEAQPGLLHRLPQE